MTTGTPRPVPIIQDKLTFSRKKRFPSHIENQLYPKSPIKSAPPVSRIFRHRNSSTPGALSVSFRQPSQQNKSTNITSPLYKNTEKLYFDQCFTKLSVLGAGCFGEVFKVQSRDDGKLYAVKKSRERFRGDFDRKQRLEEVNKNELLQGHRNCVKFYNAWEELDFLYIQTELCEMSLKEYSESVQVVEEKEIWNMVIDLCLGLKHLHDSQFGHMDIKPANLFLGRDGLYKIGDFGLVVELTRDLNDAMDGDSKYLAPELMESNFTKAADIFSLGITLLELACGLDLPSGGMLWHRLRNNELPNEFTQGLSDDLILLISSLMNADPRKRPNVDEILALPCVTQARKNRGTTTIWNILSKPLITIYEFIYMLFCFIYSYFATDKPTEKPQPSQNPIYSFVNGHESIFNETGLNCAGLSPVGRWRDVDELKFSPIFQGSNKDQRSPLHKRKSGDSEKRWLMSSPSLKPNNLDLSSNYSPASEILSELPTRTRLFDDSEYEDVFHPIVSKNLLHSFNTSD